MSSMVIRGLTDPSFFALDPRFSSFPGSFAGTPALGGSALPFVLPPVFGGDVLAGSGDLPPELARFVEARAGGLLGGEMPEELRRLLQQMNMREGLGSPLGMPSGTPGAGGMPDLANMSAQDLLQLLIDYLSNFGANQNNQQPPRMLGTLGQGGGAMPGGGTSGGGGGGGGVAPAAGSGGGGGGGPVGSTNGPVPIPASSGAGGDVERWRPMVREYAAKHGIPENEIPAFENYVLAMMKVESGGNPEAIGDNGHSVGLFQMHDQGAGHGMSVEARKDPRVQFDTMMPKFVDAYRSGRAQGLDGAQLAVHIAREAERPIASALPKYGAAYNEIIANA